MSAEEQLGTAGVAHRPAGADESQRANRAWWDADADEYLAAHGADPQPTSSTRRPPTGPSRCASASRRPSGHQTKSVSPMSAPCSAR